MKKRNSFAILTIASGAILSLASCGPNQPAHTHSYKLHDKVDSTCLAEGSNAYYSCDGCDKLFNENKEEISQIESIPVSAHVPHHHDGEEPSCTEPGKGEYWTCDNKVDNKLYSDAECKTVIGEVPVVPAKGHTQPLAHHDQVDATCMENGTKEYWECPDCDNFFSDSAAQNLIGDATALADWKTAAGKILAKGHAQTLIHHNQVNATCLENGTKEYWECPDCNMFFSDDAAQNLIGDATALADWKTAAGKILAKGHDNDFIEGQDATCEADGWEDYYQCSECEKYFEDEAGSKPIADLEAWKVGDGKILAKGHDEELKHFNAVAPTCYQSGVKEYYQCESCGKYFEDANAEKEITDLAAWKEAGGKVDPTGEHEFDYANKEVTWVGDMATAVAPCLTEGCTETVSETKQGTYVKDTDATCTAPEKGHYEVTFVNTSFGSAQTAANSVDNGEPHAHTYGDLVPQVDAHRENAGMKAHYQCSECSGYFDSDKNPTSVDALVIPAPAKHFEVGENLDYIFDKAVAVDSTIITIDLKFIGAVSGSKVNIGLMGEKADGGVDWNNYFGYYEIQETKTTDSYNGISTLKCDDGYLRVTFNLSALTKITGEKPSKVKEIFLRGAWSNVEGYLEVNSEVEAHHICENLIQESDTYRDGMLPHYECEECGQLFDSNKVLSTKEALLKSNVRSYAPPASGSTFAEFAIDSLSMDKELVFDIKFDNPTIHQEVGMNFYCGAWHNYFGKYWIDCDESGVHFEGKYNGMYLEELHDGWYRITADLDRLDKVVVEAKYTDEGVPTYVDYVYFSAPNTVSNRGSGLIEMQPTKVAHNYGDLIEGDFYHGSGDHISYYQCDVCEQYFDANKHPISSSDISVNKNVLNVVGGSSEEAFAYNIGSQETVYMDVKIDDPTKAMYIGFRSTAKDWQRTDNVKIYADGRFEYTDTVGAKLKQGFSMLGKTADGYLRCKFDLSKMDKEDGFVTVSHILLYKWEHSSGTIEINQRKSEMLKVLSGQFEYGTGFDFNPINKDSGTLIFDIEYTGLAETKPVWFSLFDTSESWDHYLRYGIKNDGTTSNKYTGVTTEVLETNKVRVTIDLAAACASGDVTGSPVNFNKLNFHSSWGWGGPGQITVYFLEK